MIANADIIQKNLELMISLKKGGMMYLLNKESVQGRGYVTFEGKKCPLVAANFYYDGETGEIIIFSNHESELEDKAKATFKIITDFKRDNPYFKIVGVILDDKASAKANNLITNCAKIYNTAYEKVKERAA